MMGSLSDNKVTLQLSQEDISLAQIGGLVGSSGGWEIGGISNAGSENLSVCGQVESKDFVDVTGATN